MEVVYECCCGLDVHAKTVVACLVKGARRIRTFATMTDELLRWGDWLSSAGCTHVAIESTGVYWKPVFNILESLLSHSGQRPPYQGGTGAQDGCARLRVVGGFVTARAIKGEFYSAAGDPGTAGVGPVPRKLVTEHTAVANRIQKLIESANIKLGQVASDVLGLSGRRCSARWRRGKRIRRSRSWRGRLRAKSRQLRGRSRGA